MKTPKVAVWVVLWLLLAPAASPARVKPPPPSEAVAVIDLQKPLQGRSAATVELGGGVTLTLTSLDGLMRQHLTVLANGRKLLDLEGGRFLACGRLQVGPATYWGIAEYTGGAHCCGEYAFLAQAGPGEPVRFLGKTRGYGGGPRGFPESFKVRRGQVFFEGFDNRFDYFHASHADSLLVNVPPYYYHLTPAALTIDNLPFKFVYLREIGQLDQLLKQVAMARTTKPEAILVPGYQPGYESMVFADTLGQLLVKRTILYLYARQDRKAWDTFRQDVARFYRTSDWAPQLEQEIIQLMGEYPY